MTRLLYIIGGPGAGKSTLVRALFEGVSFAQHCEPFAHAVYADGTVQLGAVREHYAGTDALPYDVARSVLDWLAGAGRGLSVVAEGSRLGTHAFFEGCRRLGVALTVVKLDLPVSDARARVAARGGKQPLAMCLYQWAAKAERVAMVWAAHRLDATLPVPVLAGQVEAIWRG